MKAGVARCGASFRKRHEKPEHQDPSRPPGRGGLLNLLATAAGFTVFRMKASNESLGSLYNDRVMSLEQLKHAGDAYNEVVDIAHKVARARSPQRPAPRR